MKTPAVPLVPHCPPAIGGQVSPVPHPLRGGTGDSPYDTLKPHTRDCPQSVPQ